MSVLLRVTCHIHFIILLISGEEHTLRSSSLSGRLNNSITSFLLGANIFLSTMIANTLCSSLNERDQDSHQYKTKAKSIVLYIVTCMGDLQDGVWIGDWIY
jgi:hypothetical protein